MSKLRFRISMSLDGFVAGPSQGLENPLGIGGMRLHEWVFPLTTWRASQGLEGGEVNTSSPVVEESTANIGATVMGRNMFGGYPGPWDTNKPWRGWWGDDPPYHHPVFVLTRYPRESFAMEGGTTFNFVTDGIESARPGSTRRGRSGRLARWRSERGPAISQGWPGRRDGDPPRADAARQRRAAVRRARR